MNLQVLFRLLWCPAKLRTPLGIVVVGAAFTPASMILNTDSADRAGAFAALFFPALAGFVIGLAVGELENCSFSWMLPGLHRKLLASVLLTGTAVALAAVGYHIALGGTYGPAIFGLATLAFIVGLAMPGPHVLGGLSARFGGYTLLPLVAIVLAGIYIDRIVTFCQDHPAACCIVGIAGLTLYLRRRFDPIAAKARLSVAGALSGPFPFQARPAARGRRTGRGWDRSYLGTSIANWIQAAKHESFGMRRLGFFRMLMWHALVGPILISAVAWTLETIPENSPLDSDQILYWLVFVPPDHATPLVSAQAALADPWAPEFFYWLGALGFGFMVAASTFEPVVTLAISLRRGWLYPLSRTHLAQVAYRGGLMQTAAALTLTAIAYCLLAVLSCSMAGQQFNFDYVPSFALALGLAFVLMPAAQWMSLKHLPQLTAAQKDFSLRPQLALVPWMGTAVAFALAVGTLLVLWRLWIPATLFQGLFIFAGLAVISQRIYRRAVSAHFAFGDIV